MSNTRYELRDNSEDLQKSEETGLILFEKGAINKSNSDDDIGCKLLFVSKSKFENDWNSVPHSHFFAEMFYVLGGKGQFLVEKEVFDIARDSLVIVNANAEHTEISIDKDDPLEYIVLGIEGLHFHFGEEGYGFSVGNYGDISAEMRYMFSAILQEIESTDRDFKTQYCQSMLNLIMINVLRHKSMNISLATHKKISRECATVKDYIDKNFKNNLTLDELSDIAHLNKYYLVHNFSKTYGLSPINYLLEKRIEECKHLITTTNLSLSQISQIVGFSSSSYFSQSFKRIVKLSPMEYKKRVKSKK